MVLSGDVLALVKSAELFDICFIVQIVFVLEQYSSKVERKGEDSDREDRSQNDRQGVIRRRLLECNKSNQVGLQRGKECIADEGVEKYLAFDLFKPILILLRHAIASEKKDCEKDQQDEDNQKQGPKKERRSKVREERLLAYSIIAKLFLGDF